MNLNAVLHPRLLSIMVSKCFLSYTDSGKGSTAFLFAY